MAKKTIHLLFNKTSKVLLGETDAEGISNNLFGENVLVKKVSLDPEKEYWFGDYDSGKVYKFSDRPPVHQNSLRLETSKKILEEFDLFTQINIILEQLDAISGENKTEKFKHMVEKITSLRESYLEQKQSYIDNPEAYNWIGDDDLLEAAKKYNDGFTK